MQIESRELQLEIELLEGCERPSVGELRLVESIWPELSEMMRELVSHTASETIN